MVGGSHLHRSREQSHHCENLPATQCWDGEKGSSAIADQPFWQPWSCEQAMSVLGSLTLRDVMLSLAHSDR